jgi:DnaJ-class molecular chaperone
MEKNKQPPCPACGGTGQISTFKGESRFLLTEEECPFCSGLGYLLEDTENNDLDEAEKKHLS